MFELIVEFTIELTENEKVKNSISLFFFYGKTRCKHCQLQEQFKNAPV